MNIILSKLNERVVKSMNEQELDVLSQERINQIVNVIINEKLENIGILNEIVPANRQWMNLQQCAEYVGVCVNTIKKFERRGLKVFRDGRTVLINKDEINRYLLKKSR